MTTIFGWATLWLANLKAPLEALDNMIAEKPTAHGFEERGTLNSLPRVLLNAMGALESKHEKRGTAIPTILEAMYKDYPLMAKPRKGPGYIYQSLCWMLLGGVWRRWRG
jgi:hypothetical protein